jgi:hypothetical protein
MCDYLHYTSDDHCYARPGAFLSSCCILVMCFHVTIMKRATEALFGSTLQTLVSMITGIPATLTTCTLRHLPQRPKLRWELLLPFVHDSAHKGPHTLLQKSAASSKGTAIQMSSHAAAGQARRTPGSAPSLMHSNGP